VVPPLIELEQHYQNIPRECFGLLASAHSELRHLAEALGNKQSYANTLMHMLKRREAVDSSQIEGTRTGFDGLLLGKMQMLRKLLPI
jgi:Fic family protein